jgi:hypothetical protein
MRLTPLNIQVAIIKAFYALAKKSVKYYTGLAFGKNNTCLFKEIRLLRAYIEILRNFEIVGSTITCSCCVEGDYTVLLNELSELTEAKIQFGCDNSGSMFYNSISYPFTYFYDSDNKIIVIQFSTLIDPSTDNPYALRLDEVNFTADCSFEPGTISPIEVGVIQTVGGTPIIVNNVYGNWDGDITIYEPDGVTPLDIPNNELPIPSNILNNPQAVATYWNDYGPTDWLLLYDGTQFTMLTPFDGVDYSTYIVEYNQYEGGTNSLASPAAFIPQTFIPVGTRASVIVDIPNTFIGGVAATSEINTTIPPIDAFVTVPTQASTIVEIPTDIFSNLGAKASVQFTATDTFFKCETNTNYIYTPAVNSNWYIQPRAATLSFANIEEIITHINNNLTFGYPLSLVSTSVITYPSIVDAYLSDSFFVSAIFSPGDSVQVSINSIYYNSSTPIGSYTVLPGDDNTAIVNALVADIIAQSIFTGTVTVDTFNILYFTAPVGTGSDWNSLYNTSISSSTGYLSNTYFNNGNNLTENEYTLSITAPTEGSIYNTYNSYTTFGSNSSGFSLLTGGDDPSQALPVEIIDTLDGQLYYTATNTFTSIDDFITAFNAVALTQATNVGINGIYTQIEFKPPLTNTGNFIYNDIFLKFFFNNNVVNNDGTYANGNDITECTYSLKLYDSFDVLSGTIENLTPTNYTSLDNLVLDIQNNLANTYVFGFSVNTNNNIATTFPYPFELPQSLICSTYNNYYFKLNIVYTSIQYSPYISTPSYIYGGIDGYSEAYEISDTVNNILFSRDQNTYNYPNGSEVKDGLIPDFNANNTGALPLLYSAEYIGPGPATAETPATVNNSFITELTASGIRNGDELTAFINNIYIGKYQIPATGALPSYSDMILGLNSNIVTNNIYPGLLSLSFGTGIFQQSPPGLGVSFNGRLLKISRKTFTPATTSIIFGTNGNGALIGALPFTYFKLSIDGIGDIISSMNNLGSLSGNLVASRVVIGINSSGTGLVASAVFNVVTITAPPYFGASFNSKQIKLTLFNTPTVYSSGGIVVNGNTFLTSGVYINYPIATFSGGTTPNPILIKQAAFAGAIAPKTTTKVRFKSPTQPTNVFPYGTGNWAFNTVEDLTYDYNSGDYLITNTYSGGIDPTVGQLTVDILDDTLAVYENLYNDITPQNYFSRQLLVSIFNATNPFPLNFQIKLIFANSSSAQYLSPPTSFDYFNDYKFRHSYNYVSPQYSDYTETTTFTNGVDPVLTTYVGEFEEGNIGTFITDNPCIPTVAEQTCLTNSQISKVIQHIDKLVK